MYSKGVAIIALTKKGAETAEKVSAALRRMGISNDVYTDRSATGRFMGIGLGKFVREVFEKVDAVVGVMAAGILIRVIAPCLRSKLTDPAVVCVDTYGKYVISMLSGHYGGANELARVIAHGIGATPIITTASDIMGKMSAEEVARVLHCTILNPESIVVVNSALVNGKRLGLVIVGNIEIGKETIRGYEIGKAGTVGEAAALIAGFDAGIIISGEPVPEEGFSRSVAILKPKKIAVGVGARRNARASDIVAAVESALAMAAIPLGRVDCLATVDIKRSSAGMAEAAERLGLLVEFVSVEDLRSVEHEDLSPDSRLVKEKIGVGGVCERAALINAGEHARLVLKKTKMGGVTVAVAEGE